MAFVLNLFEDLKNGIVVGNTPWIEVRTVRQARKLSATGKCVDGLQPGQSILNGLLFLNRQTFHEFDDL